MIKPQFIKKLRNEHGFSQEYIARQLNMSRPTYSLVESGERELSISEAEKLAQMFGMPLTDLLAGRPVAYNVSIIKDEAKKKKSTDMEIRVEEKHLDKFKDVLLYVLGKVGAKPNVGETVIYKLLYFIDFDYYEKFEENLLGATYIKNHHGPTPVEFKAVVDRMEENKELERVKSKYFQYEQKKYLPLKSPDLSRFSAREIQHIDEVIARLGWKTAKELSEYSHTDTPWLVHKEGESISYESVFYRDEDHSVRNYEDEL